MDDLARGDSLEVFTRREWAALGTRSGTRVAEPDFGHAVALEQSMPIDEIVDVYVPICRLLGVRMAQRQKQMGSEGIHDFPASGDTAAPFFIGIAGGVAAGKSTTARVLQALLGRTQGRPTVDLITTDSFLHPNRVLQERGLLARKGFPHSYDQDRLADTLGLIRAGHPEVTLPVYSHESYDIVADRHQIVSRPDIVIVEGLNVLQTSIQAGSAGRPACSDFLDCSVYVDAAEEDMARWFRQRLLGLRTASNTSRGSFVTWFSSLSDEEAYAVADHTWSGINMVNLRDHVLPTRHRAQLVLRKDGGHRVSHVSVRRPWTHWLTSPEPP
jgi:type I pantothenate kinase